MRRSHLSHPLLISALLVALSTAPLAIADSGLVNTMQAQQYGLVRAWFSQAQLDVRRSQVEHALVDGDLVIVLTTAGVLHAMDAETGATVWISRLGNPAFPSLGPAVSSEYVAAINGSTLYVLKRSNGLEVMNLRLGGGAGGGPALTDDFVYAPLFNGRLEAHPLHDDRANTWYYASTGRVSQAATVTADSVVWPTNRGFLYVANPAANGVRYRFETSGIINDGPVSYDGRLLFSSSKGYVYAIDEISGQQRWRYSTGTTITHSPLAVAGTAYVTTQASALHAIDIATGERQWSTSGVAQVVSVSESQLYGLSPMGGLVIMDKASGVPLGRLPTSAETSAIINDKTDRLYLITERGLVQCLHEIGADEPQQHQLAPEEPVADKPPTRDLPEEPAAEVEDQGDAQPPADNPFGTQPAGGNPFGFGQPDDEEPEPATNNPFDF